MAAPIARVLDLLGELLDADKPANVDRESVTLTGEGPGVGILLVPHRDLGGYSLVLWFTDDKLDLGWASVTDLADHDELDLGKVVRTLQGEGWLLDESVKSAIRSELRRPIRVRLKQTRISRRWRLWCAIEHSGNWAETVACNAPPPKSGSSGPIVELGVTSLMGPNQPNAQCPVPLERWHRYADVAWSSEAPA